METKRKEEAKSASHEENPQTVDGFDPWDPPCPPRPTLDPNIDVFTRVKMIRKWYDEINEVIATSRRTQIINSDRTPQSMDYEFWNVLPRLMPILEKDSLRPLRRFFVRGGESCGWGFIITPLAFTQMVKQNALSCAKLALMGKAPELRGFRANPNCMNRYGYFPLHEAAEIFSVDMIKLLIRHGASANLRTAGAEVIEGLLPLHVAVEDTCLHRYLEDNALPNLVDLDNRQAIVNYVCRLILLLCLPEMKIFLDTTRLLGEHTNNLVDEVWNYIKDGKLVHTAVLLLATQEQIRRVPSKMKGNREAHGFSVIMNRVVSSSISLDSAMGQNGKETRQLNGEKKLNDAALLLVHAVSEAGETLDAVIRSHPEVPYNMQVPTNEVLERVSSILKDHGFCPTESIDIRKLRRYNDVLSKEDLPKKHGDSLATIARGMPCQLSKEEKVVRNGRGRGWELKYARRSFFPYWRSILKAKAPCKLIPYEELERSEKKSAGERSSPIPDLNPGPLARVGQLFGHQTKRTFCSVALKMLRNA